MEKTDELKLCLSLKGCGEIAGPCSDTLITGCLQCIVMGSKQPWIPTAFYRVFGKYAKARGFYDLAFVLVQ